MHGNIHMLFGTSLVVVGNRANASGTLAVAVRDVPVPVVVTPWLWRHTTLKNYTDDRYVQSITYTQGAANQAEHNANIYTDQMFCQLNQNNKQLNKKIDRAENGLMRGLRKSLYFHPFRMSMATHYYRGG